MCRARVLRRQWYNPLTWLRRRNSMDDLLADVGEGEGGERKAAAVRGPWALTKSISTFAKGLMGSRPQARPPGIGLCCAL